MKVLIVLESYDGASNGNTISARRLASSLLERGHEVKIAAAGDSYEGKYGFGVYHLPLFDGLVQAQDSRSADQMRRRWKRLSIGLTSCMWRCLFPLESLR